MYTSKLNLDRLHSKFGVYPVSSKNGDGNSTYAMHIIAGLLGSFEAQEPIDKRRTINVVLRNHSLIRDFMNETAILLTLQYGYDDMFHSAGMIWFGTNSVTIRFISEETFLQTPFSVHDEFVFDLGQDDVKYHSFIPKLVESEGLLQDKGVQNTITISELYRM